MPNNPSSPVIVLDTHIWIWLINGDAQIEKSKLLQLILSSSPHLLISVISVWEIAMLESKKRIKLPYDINEWVRRALNAPGIRLIPLSPEIAVESTRLGEDFHGDPADRMIVASAKLQQASLATADQNILTYCQKHHIATIQ